MPERMSQTRARGGRAESHTRSILQISSAGRVAGAVLWLLLLTCWPLDAFAVDCHLEAADASQAIETLAASPSPGLMHSSTQSTALSEAIHQNTPRNSQGLPVGLSWDKDTSSTKTTPAPSGWSGLSAWAQVYQEAGASVSPTNTSNTVQVADFTTYVHLTDGTWAEVQSQRQDGIGGGHYVADFSTDAHLPLNRETLSDGSVSMDAPPSGYNDHFWPGARGVFEPGTVDGIFVKANMKANGRDANLVAQLGADWWRNATAQHAGLNVNNHAVGLNNWTKLTTQWQTLYYSSLSPDQLTADPPPGLLSARQSCQ